MKFSIAKAFLVCLSISTSVLAIGQTTSNKINPDWTNDQDWTATAPGYNMSQSAVINHNSTVSSNIQIPTNTSLTVNSGDTLFVDKAFNVKSGATLVINGVLWGTNSSKIILLADANIIINTGGEIIWQGNMSCSAPGANIVINGSVEVQGNFLNKANITGTGDIIVHGTTTNAGGTIFLCSDPNADCCLRTDPNDPCLITSTALPVELADFEANADADGISVEWSTFSEENNDHFIVEKSVDGTNFNEVAIVKGAGTTSSYQEYSYSDVQQTSGTVYYRLSQVDYDGTTKELGISSIEYINLSEQVQVYPTAVNSMRDLQINVSDAAQIQGVQIFSAQGQMILETTDINQVKDTDAGTGMYIIRIVHMNKQVTTARIFVR